MFSHAKAQPCDNALQLTNRVTHAIRYNMEKWKQILPLMAAGLTGGCVQVAAPDQPIVINLNIAVRQEILYKLDAASKKVIEEQPGIF